MELDKVLVEMEEFRKRIRDEKRNHEPPDYVIRVCQAIVAEHAGYSERMEWAHLQLLS